KAVIVATGAHPKLLRVHGEKHLMGKGVSTCATCDGAFFRNEEIAVVGGGDSAMEEATFLTRFAQKVYVSHRRDTLRASKIMQHRAETNPKIAFIWGTEVETINGEKSVESLSLKNIKTGEKNALSVSGCFVAIGHRPNTDLFKGQLEMEAS